MIQYDILYVTHNNSECFDIRTTEHKISIRDIKTKEKKEKKKTKKITVQRYKLLFVHSAKEIT